MWKNCSQKRKKVLNGCCCCCCFRWLFEFYLHNFHMRDKCARQIKWNLCECMQLCTYAVAVPNFVQFHLSGLSEWLSWRRGGEKALIKWIDTQIKKTFQQIINDARYIIHMYSQTISGECAEWARAEHVYVRTTKILRHTALHWPK